jgi:tryptophan halogenase
MSLRVKRVVIAGGGSIGWIAAAALLRTFRHAGIDVTVVDTPEQGAPRTRWTLPSQRGAHAQIGLGEADFLRRAHATYRLATEYTGWQGDGTGYLHAHADIGSPIDVTPFYKYLVACALAGQRHPPEIYSVGGAAARHGRFARPLSAGHSQGNDLKSSFTYGYHVDEDAYVALLRGEAGKSGVRRVGARITGIQRRDDGGIASLALDDGAELAADLFVDCTGEAAALIQRLDDQRASWTQWLACDRQLTALLPPLPEPPALTRIAASDAGWMFQAATTRSTCVGHVFSSAHLSDDAALQSLQRLTGPLATPQISRLAAGRRERFWVGNCVALGGAALQIEPLAGADLHFAQVGLATLLELFPLDDRPNSESTEFNRIVGEYADSLRDFTLAHYQLNRRPGAFWEQARAVTPPATLAAKLDLFAASARLDLRDHEIFEEIDWVWLLLGAGLVPRALEWQMARAVAAVRPEQITELRDAVGRLVGSMPRHIEFLQHVKASPPRGAGAGA